MSSNRTFLDSLENQLERASSKEKIKILNELSFNYWRISAQKAIEFANDAKDLAIELNDISQLAEAHNNLGRSFYQIGEYNQALREFFIALDLRENINDSIGISATANNIGLVYWGMRESENALKYFNKSIAISRVLNDTNNIASALNNIGILSVENNDLDAGIANFKKTLELLIKLNDKNRLSSAYNNIGYVHEMKREFNEAIKNYQMSLDIAFNLNANYDIAQTCNNIGNVYFKIKNYDKALEFLKIGEENAIMVKAKFLLQENYQITSQVYEESGNMHYALDYFKKYSTISDSLLDETKSKQIAEMETKYETEKKEKEILLKNLEINKNEEQIRFQTYIIISIAGFSLLIIILTIILIRQNKLKQKLNAELVEHNQDILNKNTEIESQKQKIEQQNEEITSQRDLALKQNKEIVEQKEEIIDSILYAEKIQNAVFPQEEELKLIVRNYFIFHRPRDIVSGDFYWIGQYQNKTLLAVADCTGHGVPGAFMSLLGITFLNRIILEKGITSPGEILDNLRSNVIQTLHQRGRPDERKDGMDISLITFDQKLNQLEFAGANNSLFIVRDNKILKIEADKMPIGTYDGENLPFSNQKVELKKNDTLYLFTDGYPDQFGGSMNKKLMIKNFKEILLEVSKYDMEHQKQLLGTKLSDWMRGKQQIDDILVIGLKI